MYPFVLEVDFTWISTCICLLLEKLQIDDVVSAVPVHLGPGIWGTLQLLFFADPDLWIGTLDRWMQFKVQLLGIASCGVYAFGVSYVLLKLLNQWFPLRVSQESELLGLNLSKASYLTRPISIVLPVSITGDQQPHYNPSVTGNTAGDFIVAWHDFRNSNLDIWLSRYNDDDEWGADYSPAIASGPGEQSHASVVLDEDGGLHLVWISRDDRTSPTRLWYGYGVSD